MAMMVLLQSPQVKVLGITMVSGNAWEPEEVAHTLRHRAKHESVRTQAAYRPSGTRNVYFGPAMGERETPIMARDELGAELRAGPFIVEEYEGTTVVPPDCAARLDASGQKRFADLVEEDVEGHEIGNDGENLLHVSTHASPAAALCHQPAS